MIQAMNAAMPAAHLFGTIGGAIARVQAGKHENELAKREAEQFLKRAMASRAVGSLQAQRMMAANKRLRGRMDTVLAASGFSATDAGAEAMVTDATREMSIQELLIVAQAEQEARNDEYRAALRRAQGKDAKTAGWMEAGQALISGVTSWRERFGSPADGEDDDAESEFGTPYSYDDPRIDPFHRNP